MEIDLESLKTILKESFSRGYCGQDENCIEDILKEFSITDITESEEFRIYTVKELSEMPIDSKFVHKELGRCHIEKNGNMKYMSFEDPGISEMAFRVDGYPWDSPMKLIVD